MTEHTIGLVLWGKTGCSACWRPEVKDLDEVGVVVVKRSAFNICPCILLSYVTLAATCLTRKCTVQAAGREMIQEACLIRGGRPRDVARPTCCQPQEQ